MIPEDSMLRRHYLTELKNKQQSTFEDFTLIATTGKSTKVTNLVEPAPSFLSAGHIFVGIAVFLFVVFIL